ncbi:hypothetical protein X741_01910 [Mesorhizobium sp. LNHC229A00]|nr:hypothetical protein X741_01910 [Mesorhizobium sp. LNHC229A00]
MGRPLAMFAIGRPHSPLAAEALHEPSKSCKQILSIGENLLDFFMSLISHEIRLKIFMK